MLWLRVCKAFYYTMIFFCFLAIKPICTTKPNQIPKVKYFRFFYQFQQTDFQMKAYTSSFYTVKKLQFQLFFRKILFSANIYVWFQQMRSHMKGHDTLSILAKKNLKKSLKKVNNYEIENKIPLATPSHSQVKILLKWKRKFLRAKLNASYILDQCIKTCQWVWNELSTALVLFVSSWSSSCSWSWSLKFHYLSAHQK